MEEFVSAKLAEFEQAKISRRKLIEVLALVATALHLPEEASAAPSSPAIKVAHVDHISYTCANFRQTADWYAKFFNLDQVDATDVDVALPFDGNKSEVAGQAVHTHLIVRSPATPGRPAGRNAAPRRGGARIDHVAYTIAGFNQDRVRAELKRMGFANPRKDGEHSFHVVDLNGFDVQISGIEMTAFGN